jgi:hypothetical protein
MGDLLDEQILIGAQSMVFKPCSVKLTELLNVI